MNKITELLNEENNKLITITARPGIGKTTFAKNIIDLIDGKVLYFDLDGSYDKLNKIKIKNIPIVYSNLNISINEVEETIRRLCAEENITAVVIDYLQLINNKYNEDIPDILYKLANQLDITIIIISQLSKLTEDNEISVPLLLDHLRNKNKSLLQYSSLILLLTGDDNYKDLIGDVKIQAIKDDISPIYVENVKLDKEKGMFY